MKTKILLIGIDGLNLEMALEASLTLTALKSSGYFTTLTMPAPTFSGPGWSTLLTGSTHQEHGVSDNSFIGHKLFHRPDLLSRAFYNDQTTTTFAAAGWPALVDPAGHGHRAEGGHGGDTPAERASFVIAQGYGRANPTWPQAFGAHELTPLLLAERA